jgi:hypothetical protein
MKLVFLDTSYEIELGASEVEYTLNSPCFAPLTGEWSYPFTLKATEEILHFLGNPHLPNVLRDNTKTYRVQLIENSLLFADGEFTLEYSDYQIITGSLTATPGNIPQKIWTKKLNTFDLGSDTIPTQDVNNTLYAADDKAYIGTYQTYFGGSETGPINLYSAIQNMFFNTRIKVMLGAVTLLDETFTPEITDLETETAKANKFIEILNKLPDTNQIQLLYTKNNFLGVFTGIKTETLRLEFTHYLSRSTTTEIRVTMALTIQPKTVKTITNEYDKSLLSTWTKPYYFPEILNAKHYSGSSVFNGTINKTEAGIIKRNTNILTEKTKYSLVPMFKLSWVLTKLFQLQGYTITGTFLQHPDVQKILIFNLFTTDKMVDNIAYPINIHNPTITYANHLPDETFADYLQMIIDLFNLQVQFNPLTKTVDMSLFNDVLEGTEILDLTGRVSYKPRNNHQKTKKTQVSYTIQGDALAKDETAPYESIPPKSIVEAAKDEYDTLQLKITGLTTDATKKPKIEAEAISPLFDQSKKTNPLRFVFWENKVGKIEIDTLTFDLTKANGVYQKFLKSKIEYNNNTLNIEVTALLSIQEVVSFNFKRKLFAFEVFFLASSLSNKLRSNQDQYAVDLKLKRFNYLS